MTVVFFCDTLWCGRMSRESQALGEDVADEDKKKTRPRSPQSPGERRSTSLANSPSPSRPQSSSRARRAGVEVNQLRIQTATKLGMVPAVATAGACFLIVWN
jgi:hypothetical protein